MSATRSEHAGSTTHARRSGSRPALPGYAAALVGVAVVTVLCAPLHDRLTDTTVALAFLLVVLLVGARWGSWPALAASLLGTLSFNFFFLPPLYTFAVADSRNWVALGALLVTALTAGQLSELARRRAAEVERDKTYERGLIDACLDPLVTVSAEGMITDANEAAADVTGTPRRGLVGTQLAECFTEPASARDANERALRDGRVRDCALTIRHRVTGRLTNVLYSASAYGSEDARGIIATARRARD